MLQTQLKGTEEAERALKRGSISGYLEFTPMFSSAVFNKAVNNEQDDEATTDSYDNENTSSLFVNLDLSGMHLDNFLRMQTSFYY